MESAAKAMAGITQAPYTVPGHISHVLAQIIVWHTIQFNVEQAPLLHV